MSNRGGVLFTDNTKGFTLIELLAVIVILAIIALIATPIVLNIIENARFGAAKSSAIGYVEASEKGAILYLMENKNNKITGDCSAKSNVLTCGSIPLTLDIKGSLPSSGTITFDNQGNVSEVTDLTINGYKFSYSNGKWTGDKGEEIPEEEKGRLATNKDIEKYVSYTPNNPTWNAERDGVSEVTGSEHTGTSQGQFDIYDKSTNQSVSGLEKNKSITCDSIFIGSYKTNYEGWRIMDVSDSGQITLIHGGTPECFYHSYGQAENSKTILRKEATSTSDEGSGKAWTKYGSNQAYSIHYMTENDYNTILKNKNGNSNYYITSDESTCFNSSTAECGKDYDMIDIGSYYWLAYGRNSCHLYYWETKNQRMGGTDMDREDYELSISYGVRPVIVLKSNVKIKEDEQDGTSSKPYNLTS